MSNSGPGPGEDFERAVAASSVQVASGHRWSDPRWRAMFLCMCAMWEDLDPGDQVESVGLVVTDDQGQSRGIMHRPGEAAARGVVFDRAGDRLLGEYVGRYAVPVVVPDDPGELEAT